MVTETGLFYLLSEDESITTNVQMVGSCLAVHQIEYWKLHP